jgi:tetratricopeptide (TPR) repeat protein
MTEAANAPSDVRAPKSFGQLLGWHLLRGSRPSGGKYGAGRRWGKKEFAATIGVSDRTVRFWLQNRHLPPEVETVERVLFGEDPSNCTELRLELRHAHEAAARRRRGESSDFSPINNLPYPSLGALFKGRDAFLMRLRESLTRAGGGHTAIVSKALYGLGGVGKTRAVVEYAHAHRDDYRAILFVIANSPEALRHNLAALAGSMMFDLPQQREAEQEVRLRAVLAWLNAHPGWLLILDNLDSKEAMAEAHGLMARVSGGHVVITSRLAAFASYIDPIELDVLSADDAAEFLLQRTERHRLRTDDDEAAARHLGEDLGRLALALEQAGAYIERGRLSFAQYASLWRENWPKVAHWADETITHYPRAVALTWETSIGRLGEPARRLLARLSWLAPEPVPSFLLQVPSPTDSCAASADSARHVEALEALDDLAAYSLVRCDWAQGEFRLHRLVQEVTRRSLSDDAKRRVLTDALHWIDNAFSGDPEQFETRARLDRLTLHAQALADHAETAQIWAPTAHLLNKLGEFAVSKALYAEAKPLLERALAIRETVLGPEHPDTATSLISLASLRQTEGDLVDARRLSERALAIREKSLGLEHPETAIVLNNLLAGLARAQGDLATARALCERALAIREKALGPEHPDTARSLNDLSSVLRCLGDLATARPLCERALQIREKALGCEHADTARSLTSLALLLQSEGDFAGARSLHERALAIRERLFGPEHPLTARSLNNLADALHAQGDLARARALYERALTIREKSLGPEHLDTTTSFNNLARLLQTGGELARARPLFARARTTRE